MEFNLHVNLDNAAFDPDGVPELQRILKAVIDNLEYGVKGHELVLRDINGNIVGKSETVED